MASTRKTIPDNPSHVNQPKLMFLRRQNQAATEGSALLLHPQPDGNNTPQFGAFTPCRLMIHNHPSTFLIAVYISQSASLPDSYIVSRCPLNGFPVKGRQSLAC